jgi:hypothetical protein
MQAGEEVDMICPHYYAYGGEEKWSHFGAKKIRPYTDLEFKLEVLECESSIDAINQKNQMAGNNAPLVEKRSDWDDDEPIIGSGLILPSDQDRDNNILLKKAKKLADTECT